MAQIDYLIRKRRIKSIRAAAEQVAAECLVPGPTFAAAVDRLRLAYTGHARGRRARISGGKGTPKGNHT